MRLKKHRLKAGVFLSMKIQIDDYVIGIIEIYGKNIRL